MKFTDWKAECQHHETALNALRFERKYIIRSAKEAMYVEEGGRTVMDKQPVQAIIVQVWCSYGRAQISLRRDYGGDFNDFSELTVDEMQKLVMVHQLVKNWMTGISDDLISEEHFNILSESPEMLRRQVEGK